MKHLINLFIIHALLIFLLSACGSSEEKGLEMPIDIPHINHSQTNSLNY